MRNSVSSRNGNEGRGRDGVKNGRKPDLGGGNCTNALRRKDDGVMTTDRQRKQNAKQKSENYFKRHRKSRLARGGYWRHDYRFQLAEIGKRKPERLIDIGCGPGTFLFRVEKAYPEIQLNALDILEEMIRETRERLSDTAVATVGDSENMPLSSEQYDAVTCNMSIHHNPHPEKALGEMARILKPGGARRCLGNSVFPRQFCPGIPAFLTSR